MNLQQVAYQVSINSDDPTVLCFLYKMGFRAYHFVLSGASGFGA